MKRIQGTLQDQIQSQLERLMLASDDDDFGGGGGLDVDFEFIAEEDLSVVMIKDSQERTLFEGRALLGALEAFETPVSVEDFWHAAFSVAAVIE